jgi:hypothetical protein
MANRYYIDNILYFVDFSLGNHGLEVEEKPIN